MASSPIRFGYIIRPESAGVAISVLRDLAGEKGSKAVKCLKEGNDEGALFYARWAASLGNAMLDIDTAPTGELR